MIKSEFRHWCVEKYYQYRNEVLEWEKVVCTEDMTNYFRRNKWFLKKEFKRQKALDKL